MIRRIMLPILIGCILAILFFIGMVPEGIDSVIEKIRGQW